MIPIWMFSKKLFDLYTFNALKKWLFRSAADGAAPTEGHEGRAVQGGAKLADQGLSGEQQQADHERQCCCW